MPTEHTHVWLPDGEGLALLSDRATTSTAIIYVHGFWGSAESTWEDIIYYVDAIENLPFRDVDLYFFDYPAEQNIVIASVRRLKQFISKVYPCPPRELFEADDYHTNPVDPAQIVLRDPEPYTRLILVGHSLGGVVIRRLVADVLCSHEDATGEAVINAEVRLFAPAHVGFRPAGKMKVAWTSMLIGPLLRMVAYGNRAFEDLKEGCQLLVQLQRETEQKASEYPHLKCLRPFVLWGELEDVVNPGRYDTDLPSRVQTQPGKGHIDICKITEDYRAPAYFASAEKGLGAY